MTSHVPWKELALIGVGTLGVCCAIGWMTGAENLEKKKKQPQRGPNGNSVESQECDALIAMADNAMKKGSFADVEQAYLRALEVAVNSEDPRLQIYPLFINRRLAEVYDKLGKYNKCIKHIGFCIDYFVTKEDANNEELQTLVTMLERAVQWCMDCNDSVQLDRFLTLWLEVGTKIHHVQSIVMASMLLGKQRMSQDKLSEAETFLRKATGAYTDPASREELWFNAKTLQLECLTRLDRHEGAKQCIKELADFLLNSDNFDKQKSLEPLAAMAPELLISMGDRCVFLGYYEEAEEILKSVHALMKRKGSPPTELAQVDHNLAIVWSATGRQYLAREKIREMTEYLRTALGSSIFPSRSKYLHTRAVKHENDGTTIVLHRGKSSAPNILKAGSVLVVKFEDPESDTPKEVEYTILPEDESIRILSPVNYTNYIKQLFTAEIAIYTGADKTIPIGNHFVFIPTSTSSDTTTATTLEDLLQHAAGEPQTAQAILLQNLLRAVQEGGGDLSELGEMGAMGELMGQLGEMGDMGELGDMGDMGDMGEIGDDDDEYEEDIGEGMVGDEDEEDDDDEEDDEDYEEHLVLNK